MSENHLVITIGRQNGSGGRYIGEKLAEELGIKCYDSELITGISKANSKEKDYIKKFDETPSSRMYFAGQPIPVPVFLEQSKYIEELANKESCILIGRCSDYVLRNHKNVINIFVSAPLGARIERVSRREEISIVKAEKIIAQKDRQRANYYNLYSGQQWGAAANYHLCLDTSQLGIDGSLELIHCYIKMREQALENKGKIL